MSNDPRLTYLHSEAFNTHEGAENLTPDEFEILLPIFERNQCASLLFEEPALRDVLHELMNRTEN